MIHLAHIGLPPSANQAYFNLPRGGRSLSDVGKRYKTEMKVYLTQKYRRELLGFVKNIPYLMHLRFYLETLENKGYPKSAESRYKKTDLSNRVKLLEDVLKDVTGLDDSQNLTIVLEKKKGTPERVDIWFWNLELEEDPFSAALRTL